MQNTYKTEETRLTVTQTDHTVAHIYIMHQIVSQHEDNKQCAMKQSPWSSKGNTDTGIFKD